MPSPPSSSTPARLRRTSSRPAAPWSTNCGATSSGASAPTSSASPPTAHSATSASAGRPMPRSSGAPPPTTWTSPPSRASSRRHARHPGGHPHVRHLCARHSHAKPGCGAGWSDAGVIIPWTSWMQTGDTRIIDQNWDAMTKYLAAIEAATPTVSGQNRRHPLRRLALARRHAPTRSLVATACWAYDVHPMQQMAHATGRTADEQNTPPSSRRSSAAFNKQFMHDDGFVAGADNTPPPFGHDQ